MTAGPTGSGRRRASRARVAVTAVLVLVATTAGCGGSGGPESPESSSGSVGVVERDRSASTVPAEVVATIELGEDASPTPLARLGPGRLAIGERRTGRIVAVDVDDPGDFTEVATVDVVSPVEGQRGLLGLVAVGKDLYAAWTRASDGRLVVAQVSPGAPRLIWEGPESADLANGGHLATDGEGRIIIGVGDVQQPDRVDDPDAPNGKLLALDRNGQPDQRPEVLSSGWNNPFAFTVTSSGQVWVADNAPGDAPERLGRGDGDRPRRDLAGRRAPSALVQLGSDRLGLCGYLDGDLVSVEVGGPPTIGDTLVSQQCRTGAVALDDGLVAVSDGAIVRVLRPGPG